MGRASLLAAFAALGLASCLRCSAQGSAYGAWDRFFYKVRSPLRATAPSAEVTLLIYQSYSGPLHGVRAIATSESLEVTRQPAPLGKLDPTEISQLTFVVRPLGTAKADRAALHIALQADELPGTKSVEVIVPFTADAAEDVNDQMRVPVGTMEVRVGGLGNQVYLVYLVPMLALLGWLLWRRKRLAEL